MKHSAKIFLTLLFITWVCSSCISTQSYWERKDYQPTKGGIVYYDPQPSFFDKTALDQRKQDAQMKMKIFCEPKKPMLVSERKAEEVIGQSTNYSSSQNNSGTNYYREKRQTEEGATKEVETFFSNPLSYSSGSSTSTNIVRNRVYITFECQ